MQHGTVASAGAVARFAACLAVWCLLPLVFDATLYGNAEVATAPAFTDAEESDLWDSANNLLSSLSQSGSRIGGPADHLQRLASTRAPRPAFRWILLSSLTSRPPPRS